MTRIINQFVPSVHLHDAVGSTTLIMDEMFRNLGFKSNIYGLYRDPILVDRVTLFRSEKAHEIEDDINILHFALPSPFTEYFLSCGGQRIIIFHNITPPEFFRGYQEDLVTFTLNGLREIRSLVSSNVRTIAYSDFSARDLSSMGFTDPLVLPFLIDWERYNLPENKVLKEMLQDGWFNLIFVGRLVPNKKQDDLIRLLTVFRVLFERKTRLLLVGKGREGDTFHHELQFLIEQLGHQPVLITGRVTPNEMVTYYRNAHAFVSMTEHEGFCVPLVEAMFFKLPILAYGSAAIPDTLNDSGVLLPDKDFKMASGYLNRILTDDKYRSYILEGQQKRLQHFQKENAIPKWEKFISSL